MHKRTVIYRGNLKSCNYSCSYCPFAKHGMLVSELERDRKEFERFCDSIVKRARTFSIGAVFVTPYGEASVHRWYWEGLSRLAGLPEIDRVGMQTNLSFSVEECLKVYDSFGREFPEKDSVAEGRPEIVPSGEECAGSVLKGTVSEAGSHRGKCPEHALMNERISGTDYQQDDIDREGFSGEVFQGGKRAKLSVWATFHPEMTTVDEFVSKCHRLRESNITVCAGAVGVPRNIQIIKELRDKLSPEVYLWINRMDGLKGNYSPEETKVFAQIDPFFGYELKNPEAAVQMCADRCFVEAGGKIHTCNISRTKNVNWYDGSEEEIFEPVCSRKRCSCYLAYGGRADFALKDIFGEYPVYRAPRRFRAVFFDLDGTLIPAHKEQGMVCGEPDALCGREGTVCREPDTSCGREGTVCGEPGTACEESDAACGMSDGPGGIPDVRYKMPDILCAGPGAPAGNQRRRGLSDEIRGKLTALREMCPIFLATSMPEAAARKRLKGDMDLFRGFIFASGGYLCLREEKGHRERICPIDISGLSEAIKAGERLKAKCEVSARNGVAYKVTLVKSRRSAWKAAECDSIAELLRGANCRFFTEGNCLEIVSKGRDKGTGIEEICGWLGIPAEDVLAVGNDGEDAAMERVCGGYINSKQLFRTI